MQCYKRACSRHQAAVRRLPNPQAASCGGHRATHSFHGLGAAAQNCCLAANQYVKHLHGFLDDTRLACLLRARIPDPITSERGVLRAYKGVGRKHCMCASGLRPVALLAVIRDGECVAAVVAGALGGTAVLRITVRSGCHACRQLWRA
jgi:hypothetical protein